MADVNVNQQPTSSGGGSSTWIVALLVIIVLAVVLWFVLGRSGRDETDINVDINVPGETSGGGNPRGNTGR
jgi:hypothetical protein